MISGETISELEARGLFYILGVRERSDKLVRDLVLDDPAPFVPLTITSAARVSTTRPSGDGGTPPIIKRRLDRTWRKETLSRANIHGRLIVRSHRTRKSSGIAAGAHCCVQYGPQGEASRVLAPSFL
jgi:hypothetical protein